MRIQKKIKFLSSSVLLWVLFLIASNPAYSLPVDWQGKFGAKSTIINNFRKTSDSAADTTQTDNGSQIYPEAPGKYKDASFQDYNLRLAPSIIINDSASFFGEVTTGYNNGGFFGDSTTQKINNANSNANDNIGDALYLQNTSNRESNLRLSQFYLKLFSDTATYTIGRHSFHWGLGAIFNEGINDWDRYATIEDGAMAQIKVGNFYFTPYWAKINSTTTLTSADDTSSYGITFKYDNIERDLTAGLIYGKRSTQAHNTYYKKGDGSVIGRSEVMIYDLYLKKKFGFYTFQTEIPIVTGKMEVSGPNAQRDYKANGVIIESIFDIDDNWKANLDAGKLTGEDGQRDVFHALYLNPNYQVANLMFRYNYAAINDDRQNIFDSYMSNAKYARLGGTFENDQWKINLAYIYAEAIEVAKKGQSSYNHQTNQYFVAEQNQSKDLGHELDLNVDYKWNNNVTLKAKTGYHMLGNYYKFTNNEAQTPKMRNPYTLSFGLSSNF